MPNNQRNGAKIVSMEKSQCKLCLLLVRFNPVKGEELPEEKKDAGIMPFEVGLRRYHILQKMVN